ncbi:hypothetical protein LINGRAPRIM_LOCUS2478 [Linum grandiflorum]
MAHFFKFSSAEPSSFASYS